MSALAFISVFLDSAASFKVWDPRGGIHGSHYSHFCSKSILAPLPSQPWPGRTPWYKVDSDQSVALIGQLVHSNQTETNSVNGDALLPGG